MLRAGDEELSMRTGELWWFDNKTLHCARNESDQPRTHLVFDLKPKVSGDVDQAAGVSAADPRRILETARAATPHGANEAVAVAVELYLAIRRNPTRWEEVLRECDCVERAQRQPLGVLAELLWPELDEKRRRRRGSAIGWALAQLDMGLPAAHQVPEALQDAGGIRAVHSAWRRSKDQLLYGAD